MHFHFYSILTFLGSFYCQNMDLDFDNQNIELDQKKYSPIAKCADMQIPEKYKLLGQTKPCCPGEDIDCFIGTSRVDRCYCDLTCVQFGDCCHDYEETCAWMQPEIGVFRGQLLESNQNINFVENITFSDENEFFIWVLSTENFSNEKIEQVLKHGCNCPLLNFENQNNKIGLGGIPVDDFDGFCKDLLKNRHCLKLKPTNCTSFIQTSNENIEDFSVFENFDNEFEISYNFESNEYSCANNDHGSCSRLKCEATLMSALKIADYLKLHADDWVSVEKSDCVFPEKIISIKHDTCCLENLTGYNSEQENNNCNATGSYFYEENSVFKKKYFEIY